MGGGNKRAFKQFSSPIFLFLISLFYVTVDECTAFTGQIKLAKAGDMLKSN